MSGRAFQVVADFVGRKLGECPLEQQILVYQALALAAPTARQRRTARRIALWLSRVSALQLEFHRQFARGWWAAGAARPRGQAAEHRRPTGKGGRA